MLTIHVCIGSACHLRGSYNIINKLQSLIEKKNAGDKITVKAALCLGQCSDSVSIRIDEGEVYQVNEKNIDTFFSEHVEEKLKSL